MPYSNDPFHIPKPLNKFLIHGMNNVCVCVCARARACVQYSTGMTSEQFCEQNIGNKATAVTSRSAVAYFTDIRSNVK